MEPANERIRENSIYEANGFAVWKAGIEKRFEENPEKEKLEIVNSGKIKSTIYSVKALASHLKSPKVKRLMGSKRIFITGLIKKPARVKAIAVIKMLVAPFAKAIPDTVCERMYRRPASIKKFLSSFFIVSIKYEVIGFCCQTFLKLACGEESWQICEPHS